MATWFGGLLGRILQDGVEREVSGGLNFVTPLSATPNTSTGVIDVAVDASSIAFGTVQEDGVSQPTRAKLNFLGFEVTDDAGNDALKVALGAPTVNGQTIRWNSSTGKWVTTSTLKVDATASQVDVTGDIVATGFGSFGANPATVGNLRVGNAAGFYGKTVGGTNVQIAIVGADDGVHYGDTNATNATIQSAGQFAVLVGSNTEFTLNDTTADFQNNAIVTTGFLRLGTTVAASGDIRGTSTFALKAISGGTTYAMVSAGSGGTVIGDSAANGFIAYRTLAGDHSFEIGGTPRATVSSTRLALGTDVVLQTVQVSNTGAQSWQGLRARAGTTIVQNNDVLQAIYAFGYDGGLYRSTAVFQAAIDGTPSSGNMPTAWEWYTGTAATPVLRVKVGATGAQTHNTNAGTTFQWQVDSVQKAFVDGAGLSCQGLRIGTGTTVGTDDGYVRIEAGSGSSDGFGLLCKFPTAGEIAVISADESGSFGNQILIGGTSGGPSIVNAIGVGESFIVTNTALDEIYNYNDTTDTHQWGINDAVKMTLNTTALVLASGYTVDFGLSDALGGGATATLGTIGGTGPATAGQNQWLEVKVGGNTRWVPVWA
jgi:hypothetical protein